MSALRKVLVVDDDPVVGKSFNRVLSGKGYIVVTAEDGYEALQKLQSEHYDMVFTDLRMPGMDGVEVAEKVKARQPWTPVVIVTGYGTPPGGGRAYRATVYVQDPALDARSLKLALETSGGGPVAADTVRAVEDAILTRARQLRIRDSKL